MLLLGPPLVLPEPEYLLLTTLSIYLPSACSRFQHIFPLLTMYLWQLAAAPSLLPVSLNFLPLPRSLLRPGCLAVLLLVYQKALGCIKLKCTCVKVPYTCVVVGVLRISHSESAAKLPSSKRELSVEKTSRRRVFSHSLLRPLVIDLADEAANDFSLSKHSSNQ